MQQLPAGILGPVPATRHKMPGIIRSMASMNNQIVALLGCLLKKDSSTAHGERRVEISRNRITKIRGSSAHHCSEGYRNPESPSAIASWTIRERKSVDRWR